MGYPFKIPEPFLVYRGDAYSLELMIGELADPSNPSSTFSGDDLTAVATTWAASCSLAENSDDTVTLVVDPTNAATGILILSLDGPTLQTMYGAMYIFDVQGTGGNPSPVTVAQGQFKMWGDITR